MRSKTHLSSPVFSLTSKLSRVAWSLVYFFLFRFTPTPLFNWRRLVLRAFGAKLSATARIYSSCRIWHPNNLTIGDMSTLGPNTIVYNQGEIAIGDRVIISQGAHLCASTHDYNNPLHPLRLCPITICDDVWVCADAFVGPGVKINEGAVLGARAVASKELDKFSVYAGNPARFVKKRKLF